MAISSGPMLQVPATYWWVMTTPSARTMPAPRPHHLASGAVGQAG